MGKEAKICLCVHFIHICPRLVVALWRVFSEKTIAIVFFFC